LCLSNLDLNSDLLFEAYKKKLFIWYKSTKEKCLRTLKSIQNIAALAKVEAVEMERVLYKIAVHIEFVFYFNIVAQKILKIFQIWVI
jgi:hypothetical protein